MGHTQSCLPNKSSSSSIVVQPYKTHNNPNDNVHPNNNHSTISILPHQEERRRQQQPKQISQTTSQQQQPLPPKSQSDSSWKVLIQECHSKCSTEDVIIQREIFVIRASSSSSSTSSKMGGTTSFLSHKKKKKLWNKLLVSSSSKKKITRTEEEEEEENDDRRQGGGSTTDDGEVVVSGPLPPPPPPISPSTSVVVSSGGCFSPEAIRDCNERPAPLHPIDPINSIYAIDLNLTPHQCNALITLSERCSRGSYTSYTYAKQTLSIREYPDLASFASTYVHRAVLTIKNLDSRNLVLDEREPHIVKYDLVKRERQKLDMHTDKSEWTFLIALSARGQDYEGGGTFFECNGSVVNVGQGMGVLFPGKLRHRGEKIVSGRRFLLVGFLVEKREEGEELAAATATATATATVVDTNGMKRD